MRFTALILCAALVLAPTVSGAFEINLDKIKSALDRTKDIKPTDDNSEADIGAGVAANLLGAAPLVRNEKMQQYVNRIGLWLAMQTEKPDIPWHFGVLDTDSLNAFATPGGYVFVTRGLLLRMRSEAELAGVLAHEMSHVLKQHHLQAIKKNAQVGLLADVASIAVDSSKYGELKQKAISAGTELYARGLDKDDEFEADRMGVVIAARAGYDPYGLLGALQTLETISPQDSNVALMFKTHPAAGQRLQLLDKTMTGKLDKYGSQPQLTERFENVVGKYVKQAK